MSLVVLALSLLVLCARPALGKWRDPPASPQYDAAFGGTKGPWTQLSMMWFESESDCTNGGWGTTPQISTFLLPSSSGGRLCVQSQQSMSFVTSTRILGPTWWSVKQMDSDAFELDIYTDNKCGGERSWLIGKPGECVNVTGTDLSHVGSTRRFNWVKVSAPATMSGGIQLVTYSALGRADTCDDAVPTVAMAVTAWGDKNGAFPGTCRTFTDTVINVTREIVWGCLGYGGRAVWAEVESCSDVSAATTRFNLFNRTCHQPVLGPDGKATDSHFDPKLSADDVLFLGMQGAPLLSHPLLSAGVHVSCFGAAFNSAGPGWWIPSDKLAPLVLQARLEEKTGAAVQLMAPLTLLAVLLLL